MKVTLSYSAPSNKTWNVKGGDAETLLKNLEKNGFWGRYRSNQAGSWSGKGKQFDSVKLTAKPVILMPSWTEYSKIKDGQASWDKMWKALKKHEENHHKISMRLPRPFRKSLRRAATWTQRTSPKQGTNGKRTPKRSRTTMTKSQSMARTKASS